MDKGVEIQPMAKKPASLLPSDDSFQSPDINQPQPQPSGPKDSSAQSQPVSGPQGGNRPPAAPQGGAKIVIKYPDGTEEEIDVVNIDSVRRVAKASQVLKPPKSALSSSFPQTAHVQQHSTSSLPAVLVPNPTQQEEVVVPRDTTEEVTVPVDNPVQDSTTQTGTGARSKKPTGKTESSASKKKSKSKKPQQTYQSVSAPMSIGKHHQDKKIDSKKMLSQPLFG